ncbi:MAG: TonB-dependent receptor [Gammaproteobacteria bacterium]|nr:TonB-dependent receptor [Gammaproteobacteria bacterium]
MTAETCSNSFFKRKWPLNTNKSPALKRCRTYRAGALFAVVLCVVSTIAQESEEDSIEEVVVVGNLGSLPIEEVETVYGFGKTLLLTPRSASSVSDEMINRFGIRDIDELIAVAPGTFTQSFFGVAGALDIRGTPGETYFRGIRRLDNPGNYPTPIGASDRIDIVRGPASPIYGPAKIGGYLNFNPKSARIEHTGEIVNKNIGAVSLVVGSWDKLIVTAETGGATQFNNEDFGYYLYAEVEDSESYYRNNDDEQTLLQASFDVDLSEHVHLQFGGMFHAYKGQQNAGWNRLTQELIDQGVYVTGQPFPLDTNGDGFISHQEFDLDGDGFTDLNPFAAGLFPGNSAALDPGTPDGNVCSIGDTLIFGCRPDLLRLVNVGSAIIDGSYSLTAPDDTLENDVITLYFDVIWYPEDRNGWKWANQVFFEAYDNLNENAYGFSQFHDTWVVENKLVASNSWRRTNLTIDVQLSPSLRYTNFDHADDFTNEYFDRRDLTQPAGPLDTRLLSTQIDDDYTEYYIGNYLDIGLAALADLTWNNGLSILAGIRWDTIDMESRQPVDKLLFASANNFCAPPGDSCVREQAQNSFDGFSWTLSVNYNLGSGLIPYATVSTQSTVIAGQGAEITTDNIADGGAFDTSKLLEIGLKVSLIENSLYGAVAIYEQDRTDFSAQSIVTNQATQTEGVEFEMRWVVTEQLLVTVGYSAMEVINLNTLNWGSRFSFIGSDDIPGVAPETFYGGSLVGTVIRPGERGARRAGMPSTIGSITATYDFGNGFAISGSAVNVDSVHSGFSNSVLLPAYTLINAGLVVEKGKWMLTATAKNLSDERYFRSNFPNLFGGAIVLPELPRNFQTRVQYSW